MMRWTTVSALLLLLGGATYGVWHLMDPSGPTSGDDALLASSAEAADPNASPGAAMSVRGPGGADAGGPGSEVRGGALRSRWEDEQAQKRAALAKRIHALRETRSWWQALAEYRQVRTVGAPHENLKKLEAIFQQTTDPMARQNLIFLAVLTLPADVSYPWLETLRGSTNTADAEDALVALAFDGEPTAKADFTALSRVRSDAKVRRLWDWYADYEAIVAEGPAAARAILRSYRAIEVLDRQYYFKATRTPWHETWVDHPHAGDPVLRRELEEAWFGRYRGHPGSDDIAWRVGRAYTKRGDHLEACRWYAVASVVPDQDVTYPALRDLLLTCELILAPEDVWRISTRPEDPNFDLLDYVAMRRVAVSRGFDAALDHARMRARAEPESLVGHAWNVRRSRAVPHGVHSGEQRLPAEDPLLRMSPWLPRPARPETHEARDQALSSTFYRSHYIRRDDARRIEPCSLALAPDVGTVAAQLRAWETMAELARRERAVRGTARADLIYKQAAIAYHHPKLLFPCWDWANRSFGSRMQGHALRKVLGPGEALDRARERFEQESFAPYLAIALFDRLEREHPEYPRLDKVLYSRGMAWKQLMDFMPFDSAGAAFPWATREERMDETVRALVQSFERLAAAYPDSTLTDDAVGAVAYWRRARPKAFGR